MYGKDIFSGISKSAFVTSHKTCYPYIKRTILYIDDIRIALKLQSIWVFSKWHPCDGNYESINRNGIVTEEK